MLTAIDLARADATTAMWRARLTLAKAELRAIELEHQAAHDAARRAG